MNLQIELNDKILEAIKAGEARTLTCRVSVKPKQVRKKKQALISSKEVNYVIEYWNDHPKRKILEGERNLGDNSTTQIPRIQAAINKLGMDELLGYIDMYQEQCGSGKYLTHDRNLAYKNLMSFCTALLKDTNKWWMNKIKIKDEDEELTEWIADSFAVKFLNRSTFGIVNGTSTYEYFYKTHKVLDKIKGLGYNEEDSLKHLLKCIKEFYDGKTVCPAMMCSEFTVKTLLPQYFKMIGK